MWSPPNQVGQNNGSSTAYYPQLYELSNVVSVDPTSSRAYGAANSVLSANYYGLHTGDTISTYASLSTAALQYSNVGSYAITAGGAVATSPSGLVYRYVYVPGTLTIDQRNLTVTYTANPTSMIYGQSPGTLSGAVGLVNGNTLSGVTSGAASWGTTAGSTSPVASYAINGSGLSGNSANYTFSFQQAAGNATAFTVNQRNLTVTANAESRTYTNLH